MKVSKKKKLTQIGLIFSTVLFHSCYYDKAELLFPDTQKPDCTIVSAKFSANVLPLVQTKCAKAGCHDITGSGGYILKSYSQISGAKDKIYNRVVVQKTMPPTGPLSFEERSILECWIDSGAVNN